MFDCMLFYSLVCLAVFHQQFFSFLFLVFKKRLVWTKKSLKIPKGQSESVYRRTDNTMAKRKSTKGQTTIHKTNT